MTQAPRLSFTGDDAHAEAVVLLLHGGTVDSFASVRAYDPSVLRLIPFGRSVLRAGDGRITLASLRYAVRGWNGGSESPLADARWALDRIAERFGNLPIGLVGHSMGGRVALRVADHESVLGGVTSGVPSGEPHGKGAHRGGAQAEGTRGGGQLDAGVHDGVRGGEAQGGGVRRGMVRSVAALAPWLPPGEPISPMGERAVLLVHGTADHTTDPARTAQLAEKLALEGTDVELVTYPGARHAMLFPSRRWHTLVAGFMVKTLLGPAAESLNSQGP